MNEFTVADLDQRMACAVEACRQEWIRYLRHEGMSETDIALVLFEPLEYVRSVLAVRENPHKPIAP